MKDNKIIAEYLGYKYFPFNNLQGLEKPGWYELRESSNPLAGLLYHPKSGFVKLGGKYLRYICRSTNDFDFHSSWDSLMPVIQKLERDTNIDFYLYHNGCKSGYGYDLDSLYQETKNWGEKTWIQNTYLTVIETIKGIKHE